MACLDEPGMNQYRIFLQMTFADRWFGYYREVSTRANETSLQQRLRGRQELRLVFGSITRGGVSITVQ